MALNMETPLCHASTEDEVQHALAIGIVEGRLQERRLLCPVGLSLLSTEDAIHELAALTELEISCLLHPFESTEGAKDGSLCFASSGAGALSR